MYPKTLKEEILKFSGIISESSKIADVRYKIEKLVRRGLFSNKPMDTVLKELSGKMKISIVSDDSLEGTGTPHFKVDLDKASPTTEEKFVFYNGGD